MTAVDNARRRIEELEAALELGIRWKDDGPCWCQTRRKAAALNGTKVHTRFCQAARSALSPSPKS